MDRIAAFVHGRTFANAGPAEQASDAARQKYRSASAYRIGDRTVVRGSTLTTAGVSVGSGEPILVDTIDPASFGRAINTVLMAPVEVVRHPRNQAEWQLFIDEHRKIYKYLKVRSEIQLLRLASFVRITRSESEVIVTPMRRDPDHKSWFGVVSRELRCTIEEEDIGRTVDRLLSEKMPPLSF